MTKKNKARLSRWFVAVLALILISWIVADSPSFKSCVNEAQHQSSEDALKNDVAVLLSFLHIRKDCVGEFVENKGEAILATFTVILAISTILLWLATRDLFEAGEKQIDAATKAANAADLNARAVIALQLALIQIRPANLSRGATGMTEHCSVPFIEVQNLGKSRASAKEVLYGWTVGDALPADPSYQFIDRFPMGSFIEPDSPTSIRKFPTMVCVLKPGQWAEICKGNCLWFYVDLIYDDFMGETRHHAFCWRWTYTGNGLGWHADETPAYNRKT